MKQDQRLAVIFAVAVLAAGIGGAYISEAKIQMQNLKAVMISDGMEMVKVAFMLFIVWKMQKIQSLMKSMDDSAWTCAQKCNYMERRMEKQGSQFSDTMRHMSNILETYDEQKGDSAILEQMIANQKPRFKLGSTSETYAAEWDMTIRTCLLNAKLQTQYQQLIRKVCSKDADEATSKYEEIMKKNANRDEWVMSQHHPDQDDADLLSMCPPWSNLKMTYGNIKARYDQLQKLYEHFKVEMSPWEMKVPSKRSWDIEREIEKIKGLRGDPK
ncbi:unnamed protein product [Cladocopium goreaui]|uniref:Uncharacterized protein n=1 Tax=Cladocopium goreaui TaxID=2562237 RepID=A0A9P1DUL9_9DINO|nr:unnamed protein product [Cladocopium goreaui]